MESSDSPAQVNSGGAAPHPRPHYCDLFSIRGAADRIAGLVFGHALGDAIGLTTEFVGNLPAAVTFPYTESIRGVPPCDWTDDTDLMILLMVSLAETNHTFTPTNLAPLYKHWVDHGLTLAGDTVPTTPNGVFKFIVSQPDYITDPMGSAARTLAGARGGIVNNSPLTRIAVMSIIRNPAVAEMCAITHADSRCIGSCVFFCDVLRGIVYEPDLNLDVFNNIVAAAAAKSTELIAEEHRPLFQSIIAGCGNLRSLALGELKQCSHIFTCLSVIVYTINVIRVSLQYSRRPSWKKTIDAIVLQGGDADANAAVAGALLGAYLGYHALPGDCVAAMPYSVQLDHFTARFISQILTPTTVEENAAAVEAAEGSK